MLTRSPAGHENESSDLRVNDYIPKSPNRSPLKYPAGLGADVTHQAFIHIFPETPADISILSMFTIHTTLMAPLLSIALETGDVLRRLASPEPPYRQFLGRRQSTGETAPALTAIDEEQATLSKTTQPTADKRRVSVCASYHAPFAPAANMRDS
ncbi:hypothetical protein FRC07_008251 [Ceratobasidium sp. 392]|nr:hypothetical protein FRC07_008251 [Ceratobasidium sp. 392]